MSSNITYCLRRYTTLPYLLDILYNKRLALLDPSTWEDKNDSYYLDLYKTKKKLKSLLALCFADAPETYQHWKIYAGNTSGVCIEFDRDKLLAKIETDKGLISNPIEYKSIAKLQEEPITIHALPFIKRYAFKDEQEFRIIYENCVEDVKIKYFSILPDDINCILINPWVNKSVFNTIHSIIKKIEGCDGISVRKSTVVENENWKKIGEAIVNGS